MDKRKAIDFLKWDNAEHARRREGEEGANCCLKDRTSRNQIPVAIGWQIFLRITQDGSGFPQVSRVGIRQVIFKIFSWSAAWTYYFFNRLCCWIRRNLVPFEVIFERSSFQIAEKTVPQNFTHGDDFILTIYSTFFYRFHFSGFYVHIHHPKSYVFAAH